MQQTIAEAQDNLISTKITQAAQANKTWLLTFPFKVGKQVLLSTLHRWWEIEAGDPNCITKFMPHFDGPFVVKSANEWHSTVTLDLPNLPHLFPVFHTSELHPLKENDNYLSPARALILPEPVTINGQQEFYIDKIVDERIHRKKTLYRICWQGEGPEGDKWLPAEELANCAALDLWITWKTTSKLISSVTSNILAGSFSPTGFWHTCALYTFYISFYILHLLPFLFSYFSYGGGDVNILPVYTQYLPFPDWSQPHYKRLIPYHLITVVLVLVRPPSHTSLPLIKDNLYLFLWSSLECQPHAGFTIGLVVSLFFSLFFLTNWCIFKFLFTNYMLCWEKEAGDYNNRPLVVDIFISLHTN
jgi:hypothetical protein